jgi:hypothetical protein
MQNKSEIYASEQLISLRIPEADLPAVPVAPVSHGAFGDVYKHHFKGKPIALKILKSKYGHPLALVSEMCNRNY